MPAVQTRWCYGRLFLPDTERCISVWTVRHGQDRMSLVERGAGNITARFISAQRHKQDLPTIHSIERKPDPDIGHWTMVTGNIYASVCFVTWYWHLIHSLIL